MTSTVSFSGHAHINTVADKQTATKPHADSFLHKQVGVAGFLRTVAAAINDVAAGSTGDWFTANMRSNMSPRSQRLMRACD